MNSDEMTSAANFGDVMCVALLTSSPDPTGVKSVCMGDKGRVRFRVSSAFLSGDNLTLKAEIDKNAEFSCLNQFYTDFVGQLVVRRNFTAFLPILANMTPDDYDQKLMLFNHIHFTASKVDEMIEFSLHVSYLHDVLVDLFLLDMNGVTKNGVGSQDGSEES